MLTNLAPVAKSLMEKAGFKVDMQSMDWQTVVARRAKKDPPTPAAGTPSSPPGSRPICINPVMAGFINASCDKATVRLAMR